MDDLMKVIKEQLVYADSPVLSLAGVDVTTIVTEPVLDPPVDEWTEQWRRSSIEDWVAANNTGEPRVATYSIPEVITQLGSPLGNSDPFCKYCDYACDYTVYANASQPGDECGCLGQVLDSCGVCGGPYHLGEGARELCGCPPDVGDFVDDNKFLLEFVEGYSRDDCLVCLDSAMEDTGTFFGTEPGEICGCSGETVDDCLVCNGTSVLRYASEWHMYPGELCSCPDDGDPGDRVDNHGKCCDTTDFPDLDDLNRLFYDYDQLDYQILTGPCADELLQCTAGLDSSSGVITEAGMVEELLASNLVKCWAVQTCYSDERVRILESDWVEAAGRQCGCEAGLTMDNFGQCCATRGFDRLADVPWQACGCGDKYTRDAYGRCCDTSKFRGERGDPANSAMPAVRDDRGVLRNVQACGCAYMDDERRVVPSKDEFGQCCDHSNFGTAPGAPCGCGGQVMDWEGKKCEMPLDICGECDREIGVESLRVPDPYKVINSESHRLKCKCDFCQECHLGVGQVRTRRATMYYADDLLVVAPGDELQVQAEFQHTVHPLNPNQDVYLLDTGSVTAVLMDGDTELVAATQLTYSGFNPDGSFWFQVREDGAGVRASFSIPDSVGSGTLHISISYTTLAGVERTMTTPVAVVDVDPPHAEVEVHLDYGTPDRVCIEELVLAGCMLAGPVAEYDCSCSYADLLDVYAAARASTCRSRSRVRQQLLQHCSGSSTAGLEQTIVVNVTTFEPAERDLTVLEPVIFGDTGEVSAFASMQAIVHPAEPQEFFSGSLVIRMMVGSDTAEGELRMSSTAALTDRLGNTGDPGSLFIPPEMQFNIDTTSPTAEVASIDHDAGGTVTLILEATEAIVPPRIYLDGCVGQNCEFEAVALAGASLAEIFSDTHVYVYKKDDASPEGTWPLIFDAFTVGFDQASNRIGCSGGEQCAELTQPGQVSCFMTNGDPCELVIDMAAPELEGELSVATSNAWTTYT
jgi:hypothetical protein